MSIDCILQIFYRAITVSNCTHLYMWPLYVHTLSKSPLIFMRAHLNPRGGPVKIQGITDRSARGCACVPVCVGMREYPFFVKSTLWLLTDCCVFGHQVICNYTVHPAVTVAITSGETNDFVKQSWCQCLIKYEHLCINSPPKARMQWFVKKVQSGVSQNC